MTVVIPTYNDDPEHLNEAVVSALAQTYPHIEVVVVDDGSSRPETVSAVDELNGVHVVRQTNQGLSAARNAGIRASAGEFIYPLDADDWIEPDVLSLLHKRLNNADEDVLVVYPGVHFFGTHDGWFTSPDEVRALDLALENAVPACALFRRDSWHVAGGYAEGRGFQEDWVFWATLLGRTGGRAVKCPEAVMHYRQHPNTLNTSLMAAGGHLRTGRERILAAVPPDVALEMAVFVLAEFDQLRARLADAEADHQRMQRWRVRLGPVLAARRRLRRTIGD